MLVLERTSGDLLIYEIAANRFTTHLHVLCSIPSHRVMVAHVDGKLNLKRLAPPGFIPCWCLSQKGMVFDMCELQLGSMTVEVVLKDIKHIHLSVYPPEGKVRVAAPLHMELDTIRVYAVSKLDWIKRQQEKFRRQQRQTPQEYINRESHYFQGRRYLLKVMEIDASPRVLLKHKTMLLQVRPGADLAKRREVLDDWYRARLL